MSSISSSDPLELQGEAERLLASGSHRDAMQACRRGMAAVANPHKRDALFRDLADRVALAAAEAGDLATGFPGRRLEVRPADPSDAWLGLPAPPLDDELAGGAAGPPLLTAGGGAGAGGGWGWPAAAAALSFRSLEDALEAAGDGDVIQLLPGTHNVRAAAGLALARRVLIRGGGGGGGGSNTGGVGGGGGAGCGVAPPAVVDYRGNSPLFRISRPCVLEGFEIDMIGFAPALLVAGPRAVAPLLRGLRVGCSGDDAVCAGGEARPRLVGCTLTARKVGLRVYERARPRLASCALERCGAQGLLLQERGAAELDACTIGQCGEEGVAAMGDASAELRGCAIDGCGGPAVDGSGSASLALSGCALCGCVGGLWLWDGVRAHMEGSSVAAASSFAVLLDGRAAATSGGGNTVEGPAFADGGGGGGGSGGEGGAGRGAAGCGDGGRAGGAEDLVEACMLLRDPRAAAAAFPPEGPLTELKSRQIYRKRPVGEVEEATWRSEEGALADPAPVHLRSVHSTAAAAIKFTNATRRAMRALWVDFDGHEVAYSLVEPGTTRLYRTYVSHPWIVREVSSGARMMVGGAAAVVGMAEEQGVDITDPPALGWELETHRCFPEDFKRAARGLLLSHHRLAAAPPASLPRGAAAGLPPFSPMRRAGGCAAAASAFAAFADAPAGAEPASPTAAMRLQLSADFSFSADPLGNWGLGGGGVCGGPARGAAAAAAGDALTPSPRRSLSITLGASLSLGAEPQLACGVGVAAVDVVMAPSPCTSHKRGLAALGSGCCTPALAQRARKAPWAAPPAAAGCSREALSPGSNLGALPAALVLRIVELAAPPQWQGAHLPPAGRRAIKPIMLPEPPGAGSGGEGGDGGVEQGVEEGGEQAPEGEAGQGGGAAGDPPAAGMYIHEPLMQWLAAQQQLQDEAAQAGQPGAAAAGGGQDAVEEPAPAALAVYWDLPDGMDGDWLAAAAPPPPPPLGGAAAPAGDGNGGGQEWGAAAWAELPDGVIWNMDLDD
ncbi:MAG: hypothetical protein J3K34DRAFT_527236 [Monoraphidium minutum]|nr:MAG: hypothetical protein J3K34DRAFT_527236 [Monoraphidium minutum]